MPHEFVSFFVCDIEKFVACCISTKKNYYNLTNISHKIQTRVTEFRNISAKSFKSIWEKVKSLKKFTTLELLHKWFLWFSVRFFFSPIYLTYFSPIFLTYLYHIRQTYFEFVFIFVKGISSRF